MENHTIKQQRDETFKYLIEGFRSISLLLCSNKYSPGTFIAATKLWLALDNELYVQGLSFIDCPSGIYCSESLEEDLDYWYAISNEYFISRVGSVLRKHCITEEQKSELLELEAIMEKKGEKYFHESLRVKQQASKAE